MHDVFFFHFISLLCPWPFPVLFSFALTIHHMFLSHKHAHSSTQDQDPQKQMAVVFLNSNGKACQGSDGPEVTTLCLDAPPASKYLREQDWHSLLCPSSVSLRPNGSLKFSLSLNDVGQCVDSLCRGLRFIDRTCSEGELELKSEPAPATKTGQSAHMPDCKPATGPAHRSPHSTHTLPHLIPSLTSDYKYMVGISPTNGLSCEPAVTATPPLSKTHLHPHHSPSSSFLRLFLPFSHSSTLASLQWSELGSYASRLHITKSSSGVVEGSETEFAHGDLISIDSVFEMNQNRPSQAPKGMGHLTSPHRGTVAASGTLQAPLCYMDGDSDLDHCPTPVSEKTEPLSPYSVSWDCCRWVTISPLL